MYNPSWYAFFVKTGDEDNVKERIIYKLKDKYKIYVPKRRLKEFKNGVLHNKTRLLFPGYVIVNGAIGIEDYYNFKEIPGLFNILRSETNFLKIKKEEIDVVSKLVIEGDILGLSKAYMKGDRVVIFDGPLKELEGNIVSINKRRNRAKVRLKFMNELRTVELGLMML